MRIKINFKLHDKLQLPIQYNHIVQAIILRWLGDENYQKFIHNTGYKHEKRAYKMYSFSKLMGKFTLDRENKRITYYDTMSLVVTSMEDKFLNYIANNVIFKDCIDIKGQQVEVESVNVSKENIQESMKIYTLSPITTYSTFFIEEKKKTYYYSPYEKDFQELIKRNLVKKYTAFYGREPEDCDFSLEVLNPTRLKESTLIYKGTLIKGWNGEFLMSGSKELLQVAYNCGLGSKNSQGFGCIVEKES